MRLWVKVGVVILVLLVMVVSSCIFQSDLDKMKTDLQQDYTAIKGLVENRNRQEEIKNNINSLKDQVNALDKDINKLLNSPRTSQIRPEVDLNPINTTLGNIQTTLDGLSSKLNKQKELENQLEGINRTIRSLQEQIDKLKTDVGILKSQRDLDKIIGELDALKGSIRILNNNMNGLVSGMNILLAQNFKGVKLSVSLVDPKQHCIKKGDKVKIKVALHDVNNIETPTPELLAITLERTIYKGKEEYKLETLTTWIESKEHFGVREIDTKNMPAGILKIRAYYDQENQIKGINNGWNLLEDGTFIKVNDDQKKNPAANNPCLIICYSPERPFISNKKDPITVYTFLDNNFEDSETSANITLDYGKGVVEKKKFTLSSKNDWDMTKIYSFRVDPGQEVLKFKVDCKVKGNNSKIKILDYKSNELTLQKDILELSFMFMGPFINVVLESNSLKTQSLGRTILKIKLLDGHGKPLKPKEEQKITLNVDKGNGSFIIMEEYETLEALSSFSISKKLLESLCILGKVFNVFGEKSLSRQELTIKDEHSEDKTGFIAKGGGKIVISGVIPKQNKNCITLNVVSSRILLVFSGISGLLVGLTRMIRNKNMKVWKRLFYLFYTIFSCIVFYYLIFILLLPAIFPQSLKDYILHPVSAFVLSPFGAFFVPEKINTITTKVKELFKKVF